MLLLYDATAATLWLLTCECLPFPKVEAFVGDLEDKSKSEEELHKALKGVQVRWTLSSGDKSPLKALLAVAMACSSLQELPQACFSMPNQKMCLHQCTRKPQILMHSSTTGGVV